MPDLQDGLHDRHVDCAEMYGNQAEIGHALQRVFTEGRIKREDVWITSKVGLCSMGLSTMGSYMTQQQTVCWDYESANPWQSWLRI